MATLPFKWVRFAQRYQCEVVVQLDSFSLRPDDILAVLQERIYELWIVAACVYEELGLLVLRQHEIVCPTDPLLESLSY